MPLTATRAAGLARLDAFVPNAGRVYTSRRNTDYGPDQRDNVSVLSPYIRHRLIIEEDVLKAVLSRHSPATADKFVAEVFWRTYFKGHLETRPVIWRRYCEALGRMIPALSTNGSIGKAYRNAIEGKTGIDCFDAWVEELVETGYLHNHTRMWFASIWIFTLKLPWQLGADFTYRHFIDGDPASNTLSWRWVGGLHTKGKTYLARPDNIAEHTNGRFKPTGLAREAPPLDEEAVGPAGRIPESPECPTPGRVALLITDEDLHPESLDLTGAEIAAIGVAQTVKDRSSLPVSEHVLTFTAGALKDTAARAQANFGVEAEILPSLTHTTLRDLARHADTKRIVTPYAPVGPTAEAIAAARKVLAADGIAIETIRRPFDTLAWPHGTRGFFAMKEKIPVLLDLLAADPAAKQGRLL
jgi:deoxyribodipyrimidine photo-lyase